MDPKQVSFFDPLTNENFWINDNIRTFDLDVKDFNLKGIKRAVKAGVLELLEGQFPSEEEVKPKSKR